MLSLFYRDANSVDVSGGLETESSNGKDTLVSISFGCLQSKIGLVFKVFKRIKNKIRSTNLILSWLCGHRKVLGILQR